MNRAVSLKLAARNQFKKPETVLIQSKIWKKNIYYKPYA